MDSTLADYFAAWNETDADERRELLGRCLSDDVELIDPTGRWHGIAGLSERIGNYHSSAPGTKVVSASGVDEHNSIERYAWKIVDPSGNELMEGLDIAERDAAGRLQRIVMFHGPLPAVAAADDQDQATARATQEVGTMVKPIPEEYPRVMPYLIVDGATAAIDFYKSVLGATERMRMAGPDGRIGHAELQVGDSVVMLADENPEMGINGPRTIGGTPVTLHVYLEDSDTAFERAVSAGARSLRPVENQFYGDRSGQFEDPFGHRWNVATHVEDVPPDEMEKRASAAMADV